MALYQGEDIAIRLSGDQVIDFVSNDFWMLVYPKGKESESTLISKDEFEQVGDGNVYDYAIPSSKTTTMHGSYVIEILIEDETTGRKSIYRQENAFYVEHSRFADVGLDSSTDSDAETS